MTSIPRAGLGNQSKSRPLRDDDTGLSLVELIVYIVLTGLVLGAVSIILVNSWRTQENVTSQSEATTRGQVMASTVERAMRNALDFEVSVDGTQLRVRTSLAGALACQGFRLTTGQALMTLSATALPSNAATWGQWESGITQRGSTPFFAATGGTLTYTFDIATETVPVRFAGEASIRSTPTGESAPCW